MKTDITEKNESGDTTYQTEKRNALPVHPATLSCAYRQLDMPSVVAMAVSTEIITLIRVFQFSRFIRQII